MAGETPPQVPGGDQSNDPSVLLPRVSPSLELLRFALSWTS